MQQFRSIVSESNLKLMCSLLEMLPDGDVVEVGVYHGGSAEWLYKSCIIQNRTLHLFDTFSGTPFWDEELDHHKPGPEFADEEAPAKIRRIMPLAKIYIGEYPKTHPQGLNNLAFVHCDCDQYQSYRSVIDILWPLVVPGGILLFDDYPYLMGAKKAVEESFDIKDLCKCGTRFYVKKSFDVENIGLDIK